MRKIALFAVAGALLLAACGDGTSAVGAGGDGGTNAGISVVGEGHITANPDTMTVTVGVSVRRDTVSQATADAAAAADRVIAALRAAGVAEKDLSTANYSVWPEWDWSGETQRIAGYRVENTLLAKIRDLDAAGDVIDAAVAAGGNDAVVQGLSFSVEDNAELIEAARAQAWGDARAKAGQLASLANVELGSVVSISESFSTPVVPVPYDRAVAAAESATPILPGVQEVTVSIQVTFSIS